jgi:uncharacterized FlaG/YvyC family protein
MNHRPPRPSGGHTHPPDNNSPAVDQSQQVSDQLRPIVKELNRLVDRLEHLAGFEEDDPPDAPAPHRG